MRIHLLWVCITNESIGAASAMLTRIRITQFIQINANYLDTINQEDKLTFSFVDITPCRLALQLLNIARSLERRLLSGSAVIAFT